MKMTSLLLTLGMSLGLVLVGASAFAANNGKIGPAGCGLGNMLLGSENQIFAATTNGTSGNQTFGITSGTSNCGAGAFQSRMDIFVESNKVALSNDAARGQGETIAALASMLGCQDQAVVGSTLKANYGEIFEANKGNSHAISTAIQTTLRKSDSAAHTCAING